MMHTHQSGFFSIYGAADRCDKLCLKASGCDIATPTAAQTRITPLAIDRLNQLTCQVSFHQPGAFACSKAQLD